MELPKYIIQATEENKTSIGDNPCLPPEEENKFLTNLLIKYFDEISKPFEGRTVEELMGELNLLLTKTKKFEMSKEESLEQICTETVNELFQIPSDTLDIVCKLVNKIDQKGERIVPEKTNDFSFESIEDLHYLTNEIYKRRVLNSLIIGASLYYTKKFKPYFQKIFDVEPELILLYKKIIELNEYLMYNIKDTLISDNSNNGDGGKVDVIITSNEDLVKIKSEGIVFPILLSETIKGILELSISHGLPEDKTKAMYVISKSDFKLAEIWDMRIGVPLWNLIAEEIESLGYNAEEIGINFILMYLSMMDVNDFNKSMKEIFAKTKKGKEILKSLLDEISYNKEKDDFDDYLFKKNSELNIINDEDLFLPEELMTDSEF